MKRLIILAFALGGAVLLTSCATKSRAQATEYDSATAGPAQAVTDPGWPVTFNANGAGYTIFEPQYDAWDGHQLAARSAVAVQPAGSAQPVYGVVGFNALTLVDKSTRTVTLAGFHITSSDFPSARSQGEDYVAAISQGFPQNTPPLPLDNLENSLSVATPTGRDRLNNTPPKIIVATRPAVLVAIDGAPSWRPVPGTGLQRVINTRMLLLKDAGGACYLHLFDGYLYAPSLAGPWTVASQPPAGAAAAEKQAADSGQVDLMSGTPDAVTQKMPSLNGAPTPDVFVSTRPAELVQLHGPADYASIPGTDLLYADNTSGNVFKSLTDQQNYLLLSGRWYRAASLAGPWQFVPGNQLPPDFANIPDSSPKENVKASVPGTAQAAEALIANSIPQSTAVARSHPLTAAPQFDGAPQLAAIAGTPLHYVVNSSAPVIEVDAQSWYACQDGVWYAATSASGPWTVAASVPAVIYTIPPDSPLHYVTYVQVYGSTPDSVYEGYTPGYLGTEVTDDGTVVYGTGYDYNPWIGSVWYCPPITWGWGFDDCWTPWWGWGFGCGFGWGWGFGWAGCYPPFPWWAGFQHWHDHDGDQWRHGDGRDWASTSANLYRPEGRSTGGTGAFARQDRASGAGQAYNSRTGWLQAGQHARVQNVSGGAWETAGRQNFGQNNASRFNPAATSGQAQPRTSFWGSFWRSTPHNYAGRNENYSFVAPRFGDLNRSFQTYPRGNWRGGNLLVAPESRDSFSRPANIAPSGSFHGGGGGGFHGGGGGGFRGGGGGRR